MKSGRDIVFSWVILEWILAGRHGRIFGWNVLMYPSWEICRDIWLEILTRPRLGGLEGILVGKFWNGPRLGGSEGFLVRKHESEAVGEMDGDVVGQSKRGCHSVKWTGPCLLNIWNGCWVVSVDGRLIRGAKTTVVS